MRQGPGFGPRSSASARSSSGGGVRHAGSNPSEGSERSYNWSHVRARSMLPSRPGSGPSPWREASILNPGEAMWGPRNAYAIRMLVDEKTLRLPQGSRMKSLRQISSPKSRSAEHEGAVRTCYRLPMIPGDDDRRASGGEWHAENDNDRRRFCAGDYLACIGS